MKRSAIKLTFLSSLLVLGACAGGPVRGRVASSPEMLVVEGSAPHNSNDLSVGRSAALLDAQKNAVRRIAELFLDETARAENYTVLEKGLLKAPQLYVAKYKVLSEGPDGQFYRETLRVWVHLDKVISTLRDLNLYGGPVARPRAALISRENGGGSAFSSAFQTALARNSIIAIEDFPFTKDKNAASAPDGVLLEAASAAGADLLLSATATASSLMYGGGLASGFFPSRADASVKVYDVRTGAVLFLVARQGSAIDSSEAASFAKSLSSAGEVLAKETMVKAGHFLKTDAPVLVKVSGLNGIEALEKIKEHFSRLEVKALRLQSYSEGEAVFSVVPNRPDTQELASAALRGDFMTLELEGTSPQEIVF
ncbi:MAG: hypothetical protein COT18_12610, partial [Elusimicrobia bacterium CG08_land_8_20_14_0_20_59_10]